MSASMSWPTPGESYWRTDLHELDDVRSTPELPESSDIVIIGAGYAGVATAYHLLEAGSTASITLLEARGACSGATGRNGGHLRPDLYGHIPTYIERFGVEAAAELAEFEIAHVQAIREVVEKEKIACDLTIARTVDVWTTQNAAEKAKNVYDTMIAHGLKYMDDVEFITDMDAPEIRDVKNAKACATYTAGTIFPYKFILHILRILKDRGVNIQTYTPVTAVEPSIEGSFEIKTARGTTHASKVVHATNAYARALLPEYSSNIIPCKGICCHIAAPKKQTTSSLAKDSYVIREQGDPTILSYQIPRPDGSIVVGGASQLFRPHLEQWYNNTDDSCLIDSAKHFHEGYMQRNFRGWEDSGAVITKIWSGVMGYSADSRAHVGHVPGKPGQLIIAGFNGHGMPVIWLAAKGLAEMIHTGKDYEEVKLPWLLKTTQERIDKARAGPEGGDILS